MDFSEPNLHLTFLDAHPDTLFSQIKRNLSNNQSDGHLSRANSGGNYACELERVSHPTVHIDNPLIFFGWGHRFTLKNTFIYNF